MNALQQMLSEALNEGATRTKVNNTWVVPGQTIISANPMMPDKPDWELKFVEKDGNNIRGTNMYGVTVSVPITAIKQIVPMEKPKRVGLSPRQIQNAKYKIADLECQMMELQSEMENDPYVIAEVNIGGGPITDDYGRRMHKIQKQIDSLYAKLRTA